MKDGYTDCRRKYTFSCGMEIRVGPCPNCKINIIVMDTFKFTVKNINCDQSISRYLDTQTNRILLKYHPHCDPGQHFIDQRNHFDIFFPTCTKRFRFKNCENNSTKIDYEIGECRKCEIILVFRGNLDIEKNINVSIFIFYIYIHINNGQIMINI